MRARLQPHKMKFQHHCIHEENDFWHAAFPNGGNKIRIMKFPFSVLLLACMLTGMFGALQAIPAQEERDASAPIPEQTKEKLASLLPDHTRLGAQKTGEPSFYAENLYELIDGAADAFHSYDFSALIHQEYKANDVELSVDIYDMGSPLNAFGIYSAERSPNYDFRAFGAEGYVDEMILNFLQDSYYIKMSAYSEKGSSTPVMEAFAQAISQKIGKGKSMPEAFELFPTEARLPRTEKFILRIPLGYDFLGPAYQARYGFSEKATILVLSEAGNTEKSLDRAERLEKHFRESGSVTPLPELGTGAFRGSNSFEGEMVVIPHAKWTIVIVQPPDDGGIFIKEVLAGVDRTL